jgi:hypothetical protein
MNKLKTFTATYCRIEHRVVTLECLAENNEEATAIFESMYEDSADINYDEMKCIHAEDFIQDIQEEITPKEQ